MQCKSGQKGLIKLGITVTAAGACSSLLLWPTFSIAFFIHEVVSFGVMMTIL